LLLKIDMIAGSPTRNATEDHQSWNKIDNSFMIKRKVVAAVIFGRG